MGEEEFNRLKYLISINDQTAYNQLFKETFIPLRKFATSIVLSKEVAEELVADVLIHLWIKRSDILNIHHLKYYLFISIKNRCYSYLQRNNSHATITLDEIIDTKTEYYTPETAYISSELRKNLSDVINTLPPRCKMCFQLVKEEGLTYKQVAEIMDISVKTVDAQLVSAMRKLSEAISVILK